MNKLTENYRENVALVDKTLRISENFDIIKKVIAVGTGELTLYYIDGFISGGSIGKLLVYFTSLSDTGPDAASFMRTHIPFVEADMTSDFDHMIKMTLSGTALVLGSGFGENAIIVDAREYPARVTAEPENDRVMRGSRDGFVETLIFNTALIRRRIRDPKLTMHYMSIGRCSQTDVAVCYIEDRADPKLVDSVIKQLEAIKTDSLTMGQESLKECLIKSKWYNPFPKVRVTERPDAASAHLYEGSVLVVCDNSPQVMVLPTSIFSFLQETNDFYFPPLTGTYLRLVRYLVFWLTFLMTPLWLMLVNNPGIVPPWLEFVIPQDTGRLPVFVQLLLIEIVIDGLRMASMNTPDMLTNSLSVVGALILGDFAVGIGWFIPEVILYMAFVTIANFTQASYELGYAFKFQRIMLTLLVQFLGWWGFAAGCVVIFLLMLTNSTVKGGRGYLYPLIPFDGKKLVTLFFRRRKINKE